MASRRPPKTQSANREPRVFHCPAAAPAWQAAGQAPPCRVPLEDDEARHALRVLRLGSGDAVELFDGAGNFYAGRIGETGRDRAVVEIESARPGEAEPRREVWLLVGAMKGRKGDTLLRQAVELGVSRFIFFPAARSVSRPDEAAALERFEQIVIAASKQCGRARLMQVGRAADLDNALTQLPDSAWKAVFWEESAGQAEAVGPALPPLGESGPPLVALVGPEGGLEADEVARARAAGFRIATLGRRILRAETAALAAAALLLFSAGELGPVPGGAA